MKGFFAAIILLFILGVVFTDLPADFAKLINESVDVKGLFQERVSQPLINKISNRANPERVREELINKIEKSLKTLDEEIKNLPSPTKKEETRQELIREAEDLLEKLRANNADNGLVRETAEKLISSILSSNNICTEKP
ncbi:MAG: hypothetical protein HYW90_01805 [Candidatus Sungbacteria bacterium]|nr:hypothetical protein [Candidatus Sungbacteria bacterium]